ncbi:amino acid adenylation domain-containing protein [Pendulispora albinea]|uniref:Amino acid adenylation domain-containing protein n=1 Tax=Pendulispora albinea TaxID=2741071 RepID=A0ABZ2M361_9BACT
MTQHDLQHPSAGAPLPSVEGFLRQLLSVCDPEDRRPILQAYLADELARVLRIQDGPIDPQRPVGQLGVDSLTALELSHRVGAELGVTVAMSTFARNPNLIELADELLARGAQAPIAPDGQTDAAEGPSIVPSPGERHLPFPLTDIQAAYWLGRSGQFALGDVSTHVYVEVDIVGLDLDRLAGALRQTIARHDMLRAVVLSDSAQQILPEVPAYAIDTSDLRALPAAEVDAYLESVRERLAHRVLPADRWPLFDVRASVLSGGKTRLHIDLDMLILDASSWQLALHEVLVRYDDPGAAFEPLEISFRDFVLAQKSADGAGPALRAREYWRGRLGTLPPAPELPLAKNPGDVSRPRFERRTRLLDAATWQALKQRAADAGLTPSGVLLAAFAEVLAAFAKSPRFTLNLTHFHRPPVHPGIERLLGDFTSTVLLEVQGDIAGSFEERARRIQERLWSDLEHRSMSGVQVLRELSQQRGGTPVMMPVVFTSLLGIVGPGARPPAGTTVEGVYGISQTPQLWLDHQVWEHDGALVFQWDAVAEIFPAGLLHEMFETQAAVLDELARSASSWQMPPRRWLPVHAHLARLAAVNATERPVAPDTLDGLFAKQVPARGQAPAVIAFDRTLDYDELDRRSISLAQSLRRRGAHPQALVAVVMEKGWEQVVAVLGVLRAGAAYLPVDPSLPRERIHLLLREGEVRVVLTQSWLDDRIAWPEGIDRVHVDVDPGPGEEPPVPLPKAQPEDLAYVIYTSGSTGRPKGVMIDHRGAVNTVLDVQRRFAVGPGDRIFALSSLSFDLSVYDIFGALAAGATVVLPRASEARDPERWLDWIAEQRITIWSSVPALMEMLVDAARGHANTRIDTLRLVMLSGDWIPVTLPDRIRALAGGARIASLGGATEASIWSIVYDVGAVDPGWTSIPYGTPMDNQRWYVLDPELEPRPAWATGELCIGGIGLALGYWRDEARTRERFIVHPRTGERLYRTGDLGRQRPDGVFEILGREDFQVKIHGHRIELGEIEAAIAHHPGVRAALVAAPRAPGQAKERRQLVAYVVPDAGRGPLDRDALRHFLMEALPAYMVPDDYVFLESLPLSDNGKIDRARLPSAARAADGGPASFVAPKTAAEEAIARAFAGAIHGEGADVPRVGRDDDFFALGGDSLRAARLVSHLRQTLGLDAAVRTIFESPTVAGLAARLRPFASAGAVQPIPRADLGGELPLSFAQSRLWFLAQLDPWTLVGNGAQVVRVRGAVNLEALERSLTEIVRRHAVLRTTFGMSSAGTPVQRIAPEPALDFSVMDFRRTDARGGAGGAVEAGGAVDAGGAVEASETNEAASAWIAREARRHYDLERGPLVRAAVARVGHEESLLLVAMHHIVTDGWSYGVLARELRVLYAAFVAGEASPLPELAVQYADFAQWQRGWLDGERWERLASYWKDKLAGAPAALDPSFGAAPSEGGGGRRRALIALPGPLSEELRAFARTEGVTLFMVLLAALKALLSRYTRQDDIVVGTLVAGRDRAEIEPLIGFFVNQLVLRTDLSGEPTVRELLSRIKATTLDAYAHQDLPFEALVQTLAPRHDLRRAPLFQTRLVLQDAAPPSLGVPGISMTPEDIDVDASEVGLSMELFDAERAVVGRLVYDGAWFDEGAASRFLTHFRLLLEGMVAEPSRTIASLPLLPSGEAEQLMAWSRPATTLERRACVHQLFEAQVERTPNAPAVVYEGRALTYDAFNREANRLAHYLLEHGVRPGDTVGLCVERLPSILVALVAILKAGAAYVPLDPDDPRSRLAFTLEDARPKVILGHDRALMKLPATEVTLVALDRERDRASILAQSAINPRAAVTPESLAYILYTSGSTGKPKGALLHHRGLSNLALATIEAFGIAPESRVLQFSRLTFDVSLGDVFGALLAGATLCLAPSQALLPGPEFLGVLRELAITTLALPPSALAVMNPEPLPALRTIAVAGEACPPHVVDAWQPGRTMINGYGPTEATVYATFARCLAGASRTPIGRPLPNTEAFVLDAHGQLAPIGVVGELHLGGAGIAYGYHDRPALTAERFIAHPWPRGPGARLYKTGDLARWLPDGQLEFVGRADDQIKWRGFRIELGEIEAAAMTHPRVRAAVAVAHGEGSERRIAVYAVVADEAAVADETASAGETAVADETAVTGETAVADETAVTDEAAVADETAVAGARGVATASFASDLRAFLRERLPAYMVPSAIVLLEGFPRLPSGKVDRQALSIPWAARALERVPVAPRTPTERTLAAIWSELLSLRESDVSVHDDFFEMGGHSLLATRAAWRLRGACGVELPVRVFFEARTLLAIAASVDMLQMARAASAQAFSADSAGSADSADATGEREEGSL